MQASKKKKSTLFTVEGIDPRSIDEKYGFEIQSNLKQETTKSVTMLDEISTINDKKSYFPYLDEKYGNVIVSMINSVSKEKLPNYSDCFWCRHPFSSEPIGCPIRYIPHKIVKTLHSQITRESYNIVQNISNTSIRSKNFEPNEHIETHGIYETDGVFCSFNCCMAYIDSNIKNKKYHLSKTLLYKLYNDYYGKISTDIVSAPDWKILKNYGGYMTIDEFRQSFQNLEIKDKQNHYSTIPKIHPLGVVLEKKSIF